MHDGSLKTLKDVVVHYNNGGVTKEGGPGQRLPERRHPAAEPDRAGGRRPRVVHGGADQPRVRLAPERRPHGGEAMNPIVPSRRDFLKGAAAAAAAGVVPMSLVKLAFADPAQDFTFAYISDAHIQHISGTKFVRNWDRGLIRAVAETNLLTPKPDFVMFGGDLGQLGMKEELDHGAEMLSKLHYPLHCVMGEHDYYLDLGEYWSKLFGPALVQLRPQGRALRRAEQHPHLRRVDLQPLALRRAADARDGRARQPERLAVHGRREAARVAESRPRQGGRRRRRSSSSRTRRSRSSTRAGTSGPRTPRRCRRCSSRSRR